MDARIKVCLVEDDPLMGESLCDRFDLEGFDAEWCKDAESALRRIAAGSHSIVVSDIRLPDLSGEELFQRVAERQRHVPPWIFITAYGTIDRAVALLKQGAADFVTKPFDLDQLIEKMKAASRAAWRPVQAVPGHRLGVSPSMVQIAASLPRLARQASTVLLVGESGAGKEVVAREIHIEDERTRNRPFVAVNCAALPESLLEAELFGHERGAFTGAVKTRRGVFEQANDGTLFLDEIGDMPAAMQAKLLRVLQERTVVPIGGEKPIAVNVRLICATHRDLRKLVEQGTFRNDLFYRINVISVRIPSLRERPQDILWLAYMFLAEHEAKRPEERKRFSRAAERAMLTYPWPGNVRELRHCVERAWIMTEGPVLEPDGLFEATSLEQISHHGQGDRLEDFIQACERIYIRRALERSGGAVTVAANELGISRKNLWEKMRKLGLSTKAEKDTSTA